MSKHLERDIESLEKSLLKMSTSVEAMIAKAWQSLAEKNSTLAEEVIALDDSIDAQEVQIEENCLKILALHQPVAIDLRRTATILKVNNDLERIADLAVNIAQRGQRLDDSSGLPLPGTLVAMAESSRRMLGNALTALVRLAPDEAAAVCDSDDEVDQLHAEVTEGLVHSMQRDPTHISAAIEYLSVARHLERIADLATNIAEDVIYLVRGDIARHRNHDVWS